MSKFDQGISQEIPVYTVANLPAVPPVTENGHIIFVSNGAAGSPILAYSDGTNWLRSDTGGAVAAA